MSLPKKIMLILLCTLFLCVVLYFAIITIDVCTGGGVARGLPKGSSVPDFKGYSYAKCKVYYANYFDLQGHYEYSTEAADGIIIAQSPEAGIECREGSYPTVECIISKGPHMVAVPNTVGKDSESAKGIFMGCGFDMMAVSYKYSDEYPKGTVISTIPAPNTKLIYGDTVKCVISKGKVPEENLQGDD